MIKIEGLWKSFGSTEVLRGLDLEIRDGETLVIIGRSGGGKSVLLKHLCGLLKPDKGKVLVDGVDIVPLDEQELTPIRKQFGFLFQSAALFDSMTLYENVAFPLREERRPEAEIQKRVEEALCIVDLTQAQDKAGRAKRWHAETRGFGARGGGQPEVRALRRADNGAGPYSRG